MSSGLEPATFRLLAYCLSLPLFSLRFWSADRDAVFMLYWKQCFCKFPADIAFVCPEAQLNSVTRFRKHGGAAHGHETKVELTDLNVTATRLSLPFVHARWEQNLLTVCVTHVVSRSSACEFNTSIGPRHILTSKIIIIKKLVRSTQFFGLSSWACAR
jgi:hypothetical protein